MFEYYNVSKSVILTVENLINLINKCKDSNQTKILKKYTTHINIILKNKLGHTKNY